MGPSLTELLYKVRTKDKAIYREWTAYLSAATPDERLSALDRLMSSAFGLDLPR